MNILCRYVESRTSIGHETYEATLYLKNAIEFEKENKTLQQTTSCASTTLSASREFKNK